MSEKKSYKKIIRDDEVIEITQSYGREVKPERFYDAIPWIACAIGCVFAIGFHLYARGC